MTANAAAVQADLAVVVDSPRHPSGLPTVFYGSRGVTGAEITIYGATGDLHSGNYGNFVTDPAMALTKLIASMKDDRGNVVIKGFYDGVVPLTAAEGSHTREPGSDRLDAADIAAGIVRAQRHLGIRTAVARSRAKSKSPITSR